MVKLYKSRVSGLLEIIPKNTVVKLVSEIKYGQVTAQMIENENVTDIFMIDDLEVVKE